MSRIDLKNWPIFSLLDSKFIPEIQMAVVYGKHLFNSSPLKFQIIEIINLLAIHILLSSIYYITLIFNVIGNLGNEALIVTKDGMVYGLGTNISGCLGTGDSHNTLFPKKIEALCEKGIKCFAYGSGPHVLALSNKGEVNIKK